MKLKLYLRKEFRIKEQIWIRLHVLMLDPEMISSHYQTLTEKAQFFNLYQWNGR